MSPEKCFLCIAFCNRHFIAFTRSATHQLTRTDYT
nr:MAG TPA: hypothetical protein [Caudoviricetes sp.]